MAALIFTASPLAYQAAGYTWALETVSAAGSGTSIAQDKNQNSSALVDVEVTTRVSVDSAGVGANSYSNGASISSDGRFVAFASEADNLISNDTNNVSDVFVHDRQSGETTLISLSSAGVQGNGWSEFPAISANGRFVSFQSASFNLVADDSNFARDIFVHDRETGETSRVSLGPGGVQANDSSFTTAISADGRFVAFSSRASNLVDDDTNQRVDIFVHDRQVGQTTRVSVDTGGGQSNDRSAEELAISDDGRIVAFEWWPSSAPGETDGPADIFVHDLQTGQTSIVSVNSDGEPGNQGSRRPSLSEDGRFVAFNSSSDNLVANDTNEESDVFVHDRQTGETTRVSTNSEGGQGNDNSGYAALSDDGRFVAFRSDASNLVTNDTNEQTDVFVHDRQTAETNRYSVNSAGEQGNDWSGQPAVAANGQIVAFQSYASNLVTGDNNDDSDIFVHEKSSPITSYYIYLPLVIK
jgi:hypothetical protein